MEIREESWERWGDKTSKDGAGVRGETPSDKTGCDASRTPTEHRPYPITGFNPLSTGFSGLSDSALTKFTVLLVRYPCENVRLL